MCILVTGIQFRQFEYKYDYMTTIQFVLIFMTFHHILGSIDHLPFFYVQTVYN